MIQVGQDIGCFCVSTEAIYSSDPYESWIISFHDSKCQWSSQHFQIFQVVVESNPTSYRILFFAGYLCLFTKGLKRGMFWPWKAWPLHPSDQRVGHRTLPNLLSTRTFHKPKETKKKNGMFWERNSRLFLLSPVSSRAKWHRYQNHSNSRTCSTSK